MNCRGFRGWEVSIIGRPCIIVASATRDPPESHPAPTSFHTPGASSNLDHRRTKQVGLRHGGSGLDCPGSKGRKLEPPGPGAHQCCRSLQTTFSDSAAAAAASRQAGNQDAASRLVRHSLMVHVTDAVRKLLRSLRQQQMYAPCTHARLHLAVGLMIHACPGRAHDLAVTACQPRSYVRSSV